MYLCAELCGYVLHEPNRYHENMYHYSPDGNIREQATLAGLHPSTTYLVRMLALNEIERSSFTDTVVIKTREEAPVEAPPNVQVQSGGIGELIVTWQVII